MFDAGPLKPRSADADLVSDRLLAGQNEVETSFGCVDDDGSGRLRPVEIDDFARRRFGNRLFVALESLRGRKNYPASGGLGGRSRNEPCE